CSNRNYISWQKGKQFISRKAKPLPTESSSMTSVGNKLHAHNSSVGTRSTASQNSAQTRNKTGTRWNASLPLQSPFFERNFIGTTWKSSLPERPKQKAWEGAQASGGIERRLRQYVAVSSAAAG